MGELRTEELSLNMGPQHPSTHGVLRLVAQLDGETVKSLVPHIGYLHRSIEKISENRNYIQVIPYTDRMEYVAAMAANWNYALAVERLSNIQVPERAEYLRVIAAELQRIASHLLWLGTYGLDMGMTTPFFYCFRDREEIIHMFEALSGQRLEYHYIRIGGVGFDMYPGFEQQCLDFLTRFEQSLKEYKILFQDNEIFKARTQGVGILTKEDALNFGVSGPVLRASGIDWDLRKKQPYGVYPQLEFESCVETAGDCYARFKARFREFNQSISLVRQAFKKMPQGPFQVKQNIFMRVPANEIYSAIEAPRGEQGTYLVSDGSMRPYRVKYRTGSFTNLQVLSHLCTGYKVADIVAILGSLDVVMPEVDR